MRRPLTLAVFVCAGILLAGQVLAQEATPTLPRPGLEIEPTPLTHDEVVMLISRDGAEIYQRLCASCHGSDGKGRGPAAAALPVPTPDLTQLTRWSSPGKYQALHVTYVLQNPIGESRQYTKGGTRTMPCWGNVFSQTLGNDAARVPVFKLTQYLEGIQEDAY